MVAILVSIWAGVPHHKARSGGCVDGPGFRKGAPHVSHRPDRHRLHNQGLGFELSGWGVGCGCRGGRIR
jgi:hypothetical protein